MNEIEMNELAKKYVEKIGKQSNIELMIVEKSKIKMQYGTIYYYNSKSFLLSGNYQHALLGNAPFLVEQNSGKIFEFGTSRSIEYYLNEYEAGRWSASFEK